MTTTFCVSGSVLLKAGVGVNSAISGGTLLNGSAYAVDEWINQAESLINMITRVNYTDTYASLDNDKKKLLEEISSNLAGIYAIQYDMSGYTSRIEAEDMVNILRDASLRGLSLLRDTKQQDFLNTI